MKDRMNPLPQRAVGTADTWHRREDAAVSQILDCLLSRFRDALLATLPPTMGEMILFRDGSAGLDGRARATLRNRSAALRANPGIRVVIRGWASQPGSTAYAMKLGLQRVQAIRAFLLSQGIGPARIEVAMRGPGWFLVERPRRRAEEDPSDECRLQIADPQWTLSRN